MSYTVAEQLLKKYILQDEAKKWKSVEQLMEQFLKAYYFYIDNVIFQSQAIGIHSRGGSHTLRSHASKRKMDCLQFIQQLWQTWRKMDHRVPPFEREYHYEQCLLKNQDSRPVAGTILTNLQHDTIDPLILLVRSRGVKTFGFSKGKLDQDEKPLNGAIREFAEETGVTKDKYDVIRTIEPFTFQKRHEVHMFLAAVDSKIGCLVSQASNAFEIEELKWFKMSEISNKLLTRRDKAIWSRLRPILLEIQKDGLKT